MEHKRLSHTDITSNVKVYLLHSMLENTVSNIGIPVGFGLVSCGTCIQQVFVPYISFFHIILNQDIVHAHLRGSINSQSDGAMKRTTQGF